MSTIMPWSSNGSDPCCCAKCFIVGVKSLNGGGYACGFQEFDGFVSSPPKWYKTKIRRLVYQTNKTSTGVAYPGNTCNDIAANASCNSSHNESASLVCEETYTPDCTIQYQCSGEASANGSHVTVTRSCCEDGVWKCTRTSNTNAWISNVEVDNSGVFYFDYHYTANETNVGNCSSGCPGDNSYNPPPHRRSTSFMWPSMVATSGTYRSGTYEVTGFSCIGGSGNFGTHIANCVDVHSCLDKVFAEETLTDEITLDDILRQKECATRTCLEGESGCVDCGTYKIKYKNPETPTGCVKAGNSLVAWIATEADAYKSGQSSSFGVLLIGLIVGDEYTLKLTFHRYTNDEAYADGNFTVVENSMEFIATATKEIVAANCNDCLIKKVIFEHEITRCTNSSIATVPAVKGLYTKLVSCSLSKNDNT